jgi:L-2-hydroxyglutarate oxidase
MPTRRLAPGSRALPETERPLVSMDLPDEVDLTVVGGGILGLATARELTRRRPEIRTAVLEREPELARHQTGHNSGVIHAGIYYRPGSLKAQLCVAGARQLYAFCDERQTPYERCGKLIVARNPNELPRLDELERRGHANGVPGLRRLGANEMREVEPHCRGVSALYSPHTGIVDFAAVARAMATGLQEGGTPVVTGCEVTRVVRRARRLGLVHGRGETRTRFAVFCAGGWADRLAVKAGAPADPRIVPFRGAYLRVRPDRRYLVRGLIYPVPDPSLPFLGVHLSRHVDGEVSLGPTAVLTFARDGYRLSHVSLRDAAQSFAWPGTWRMVRRWWRTGLTEIHHAASRRALARSAADYVPEFRPEDFVPYFAGVRAQALGRDGRLVDDFVVSATERALHVRNAPSPAATSALALARLIADRAEAAFD